MICHDILIPVRVRLTVMTDKDKGGRVGGPDQVRNHIPRSGGGVLIPGMDLTEGIHNDRRGSMPSHLIVEILHMKRLEDVKGEVVDGLSVGEFQ